MQSELMNESSLKLKEEFVLLLATFSLSTKYKEKSVLKTTVNKKQPTVINNYLPGSKFFCLDIIKDHQYPSIKIQYNDHSASIDPQKIQNEFNSEKIMDFGNGKLSYTLEKFINTDKLLEKYTDEKPDEQERYRMNESVTDLIRSEAEFMTNMAKDEDLLMMNIQIKKMEKLENQRETELSEEIMKVASINFSIKSLFLLFFVFMVVGFLLGDPRSEKEDKKIEKIKKKKDKSNKKSSSKPKKKKK